MQRGPLGSTGQCLPFRPWFSQGRQLCPEPLATPGPWTTLWEPLQQAGPGDGKGSYGGTTQPRVLTFSSLELRKGGGGHLVGERPGCGCAGTRQLLSFPRWLCQSPDPPQPGCRRWATSRCWERAILLGGQQPVQAVQAKGGGSGGAGSPGGLTLGCCCRRQAGAPSLGSPGGDPHSGEPGRGRAFCRGSITH